MAIVLIGLPVLVAVYVLLVTMRALALKITPRAYTVKWPDDDVLRAARIKKALLFARHPSSERLPFGTPTSHESRRVSHSSPLRNRRPTMPFQKTDLILPRDG